MSSSESVPQPTQVTSSGVFARNATGMVREVSQLSASILNFIPGCPTQALAAGLSEWLEGSRSARDHVSHVN